MWHKEAGVAVGSRPSPRWRCVRRRVDLVGSGRQGAAPKDKALETKARDAAAASSRSMVMASWLHHSPSQHTWGLSTCRLRWVRSTQLPMILIPNNNVKIYTTTDDSHAQL